MLELSSFEIRKTLRKGVGAKSMYLALIFALLSVSASLSLGIKSSHGIYTYYSSEKISDPLFVMDADNPDIRIAGNSVFISGSEKSLSALDDYVKYLSRVYEERVREKYGGKAFPVYVYPIYIKRNVEPSLEVGKRSEEVKTKTTGEVGKIPTPPSTPQKKVTGETKTGKLTQPKTQGEFVTPRYFKPPTLFDRIILGFIFVIPSFFVMQVYTSSLLEDSRMRRLEILLTIPKSRGAILFEVLLPYLLVSTLILVVLSVIFRVNAVAFVLPPILLMFSIQTFLTIASRSYREATFLLLASNLFITSYLFLPAIFSGLPLSKISPITLLLQSFEGEVSSSDLAFSVAPIILLAAFLFTLSAISMSSDVLGSQSSIWSKWVEAVGELTKSSWGSAFVGASLVSIALIIEFFALFVASTFAYPLVSLLVFFALVEEILKSGAIESNVTLRNATIIPMAFFLAEKSLLLGSIYSEFGKILMAPMLAFPLLAHLSSSLTFYSLRRFGFKVALLSAFAVHFAYNSAVVFL